jgi:hypothetical protein
LQEAVAVRSSSPRRSTGAGEVKEREQSDDAGGAWPPAWRTTVAEGVQTIRIELG